jgi:S1-C subfamily serine protease
MNTTWRQQISRAILASSMAIFVPAGWLSAQTTPTEASGANPPVAGNAPAASPADLLSADVGVWFYGRPGVQPLTVEDIAVQGELAHSGLGIDDQIVAVNGQPVASEDAFIVGLRNAASADKATTIDVLRGGRRVTLTIPEQALKLVVFAPDPLYRAGFAVDTRQPHQLIVSHIFPRGSAYAAGLMRGDLITAIGNSPIVNLNVLRTAVNEVGDNNVLLQVTRGGRSRLFTLNGIEPPIARIASRPERLPGPATARGPGAGSTIRQ